MEYSNYPVFFLFGSARAGTTSLCNILDMASNGICLCEPSPQLHIEARRFWSGQLKDPIQSLYKVLVPRIKENLLHHGKYGEKNVTLGIFAKELAENFPCKLIYITRDGRECVNSMRNWHACMFGNFYREAKNQPILSARAREIVDNLPVEDDLSDYGRPRPLPGDPYHDIWDTLSHHQMLCWYWNAWNMKILDALKMVPTERYMRIDYSAPNLEEQVIEACNFLELFGINKKIVRESLARKINSVPDRCGKPNLFPTWKNWSDTELEQFWEICTPAMQRLNYYVPLDKAQKRWSPDYGQWWMGKDVAHEFFEYIYNDRIYQHNIFYEWCKPLLINCEIKTVLEIGCGHGIGYSDFFKDINYTGIDISPKEITWCKEHLNNNKHKWICSDFINDSCDKQFDLVICQGTIENMYDMDALIEKTCKVAHKYIWLAGWYGFHDDIDEHQYVWNEQYKSYCNIFSIKQAAKVFMNNGFECMQIRKVKTNKVNNPYESIILARRIL